MTTPNAPTVEVIQLDPMLYQVLKKRQTDGGDEAVKNHATLAAGIYPVSAEVITASFITMRKAEHEREALDAKNTRITAKGKKVEEYIGLVKSFTPSKTFIEMMEKGRTLCDSLTDADSKVTFNVTIGFTEDGKSLTLVPNFSGISPVTVKRATTPNGNGDDKSNKSRISTWEAYQRGRDAGDSFVIVKLEKGVFRDETKGTNIPPKGMLKWIRDNYSDSKTAAILREYKQL